MQMRKDFGRRSATDCGIKPYHCVPLTIAWENLLDPNSLTSPTRASP